MGKVSTYGQLTTRIYTRLIDPLLVPVHTQVAKICQRLKYQDVLDIASATGAQCLLLDRAGINAVGLDLSGAMIATAARRSPPTVRYVHGSALDLPFTDGSFDCVLLLLAFHEHPESERVRMLHEARRVLRPKGTLIIAEYAPPETSGARLVWGLITFIERLSKHYHNFRQFVHAGGIYHLEEVFPLSISQRYPIYSGTILIDVLKCATAD